MRGHSYYIVAQNLSAICLYLQILCEAEFKGDRLINLVDKILKQFSIQAMAWLLFVPLIQVYGDILGANNIIQRSEEFAV